MTAVLIVAKCNVNSISSYPSFFPIFVLIVAKCNVNNVPTLCFAKIWLGINSSKV